MTLLLTPPSSETLHKELDQEWEEEGFQWTDVPLSGRSWVGLRWKHNSHPRTPTLGGPAQHADTVLERRVPQTYVE